MIRAALATLICSALLGACATPPPGIGPCHFDTEALAFRGEPLQQAACLLRTVRKWGTPDAAPAVLPPTLAALIGRPTPADQKQRLQRFLPQALGGDLQAGLSHARDGDPAAPTARYFVIHDTSTPWLGDATEFPPDDADALNNMRGYARPNAVAHVFVSRRGETLLGHDFAEPWRATKLETKVIGAPAKGLFLHIELLQPRRRDPSGGPRNDAIAPIPGFTPAQYEQLALLYVAASARKGQWLIPAFHATLDEGLADAHDDPQNFEIGAFDAAVQALLARP
ncbi:MAG TPA: hypothetical protein VGE47_02860 [Burkholderiaceae bacterium]